MVPTIELRDVSAGHDGEPAVGEDPAHQRFMLDKEIAAAQDDRVRANGVGTIPLDRWTELRALLLELRVLPKAVDLSRVIDDRAIREVRGTR